MILYIANQHLPKMLTMIISNKLWQSTKLKQVEINKNIKLDS